MEIPKISSCRPRSVEDAELGHFTLLFYRGNVQRVITHVHSYCFALLNLLLDDVLVAVVVVVLLKLPKIKPTTLLCNQTPPKKVCSYLLVAQYVITQNIHYWRFHKCVLLLHNGNTPFLHHQSLGSALRSSSWSEQSDRPLRCQVLEWR